jgi:ComF family protein
LQSISRLNAPTCSICGERISLMVSASGDALCGLCRRTEPPFAKAVAYGSYDSGLRDLIHLLKYERVRPAAKVLGRMVSEVVLPLAAEFGEVPPVVIPVPLHAAKMRQRGFNQSELIARAALKNLCVGPRLLPLEIRTDVLARHRPTQSQTGLTRHQRRQNVRGAFDLRAPDAIVGRDVLLVDDVFTTGTTVSECARVLRKAGAAKVRVVTVARVLAPEPTMAQPDTNHHAAHAVAAHA